MSAKANTETLCIVLLEALCDYALYKSTFSLHYITVFQSRVLQTLTALYGI